MDLQRIFQLMIRIIFAYAAVVLILLICLGISLWSAFETLFRIAHEAFQNAFQNVPFIDSDEEKSEDELQTSSESTQLSSDSSTSESTTSESSSSPKLEPTLPDLAETANTAEKERDKQTENDLMLTDFDLEGLALQIANLERYRMSTYQPRQPSSRDISVRSPNESPVASKAAPKSVLKSSSSKTRSPPIRGTRRIRFQDQPFYGSSKGSPTCFKPQMTPSSSIFLPSKQRTISPAAYLKTGLNFGESTAESSETKTCNTTQPSEPLQAENAPMINPSSEIASNQKKVQETETVSEEIVSTNATGLPSKSTENQQIANESMASSLVESNSTPLSPEIATSKILAKESVGSLSDELSSADPSILSTSTATNEQVSNKSMDTLSEKSSIANSAESPFEAATNQETNKSIDSLSEESNSTVLETCDELKESFEGGDRCLEQTMECTSNLNLDESSLDRATEELSNEIREMKIGESRYELSVKEDTASSNKKEESLQNDMGDIRELSQQPESVNDSKFYPCKLPLSESISQQSSEESINIIESISHHELNSSGLKIDQEWYITSPETTSRWNVLNVRCLQIIKKRHRKRLPKRLTK